MSIESAADLAGMQRVGKVVALTISEMKAAARIGMTTADLDAVAASTFKRVGARSAPQLAYGFPGVTCISVNDEIVHGIPGPRRLEPGDVVKVGFAVVRELCGHGVGRKIRVRLINITSGDMQDVLRADRGAFGVERTRHPTTNGLRSNGLTRSGWRRSRLASLPRKHRGHASTSRR